MNLAVRFRKSGKIEAQSLAYRFGSVEILTPYVLNSEVLGDHQGDSRQVYQHFGHAIFCD
jgi:hypothetical protein